MSLKAMLWALEEAPVNDQGQLLVLIALADRAADDGTAAWPSIGWIAQRARCSTRTVIRHLHALRDASLIDLGDQNLVAHLPANRRPQVYDLNLTLRADSVSPQSDVTQVSPQTDPDVTLVSPLGVPPVSPQDGSGVTDSALWGDTAGSSGVTLVSHKPSLEPSLENRPVLAVAGAPAGDARKPKNEARGTRLPEPFVVTPEMIDWARRETPLVGRAEHDKFVDYWRGVAGAKGRKADWLSTWRNWMRRAHEDAANRLGPAARPAYAVNGSSALDPAKAEDMRRNPHKYR